MALKFIIARVFIQYFKYFIITFSSYSGLQFHHIELSIIESLFVARSNLEI